MAVCPFAQKRLIPPGSNDPRIQPRVAVLHVDAGNNYDLHDYFAYRSGGIESHFHIAKDGRIFQYRDTDFQADANNLANDFAISIETQGLGHEEWTPEQIESIKRLLRWLNDAHPAIKLQKIPKWNASGIGYHVQFGAPGPWTPVAKSCPGPKRIAQYDTVIVPWLKAGARLASDKDRKPTILLRNVERQVRRSPEKRKTNRRYIKMIQRALNDKVDAGLLVDGLWKPADRAAYAEWQRRLGYSGGDADGRPGRTSLKKLGRGRFRVLGK